MKRLLFFVVIGLLLIGQASRVEANQSALDFIREVERIGEISDPKAQTQAITDFMRRVQGFGDTAKDEEAKALLNKYAFNMHDGKWAVIYEGKGLNGVSSGYIMAGENPPSDAEILPTKTIEGIKR